MSIELKKVSKRFVDNVVLDGVDFFVAEGETVALLGPSGVGKSVLLKHIIGLIKPDSGEVWVDGQQVPMLGRKELAKLRSRIGYVFQNGALFDSMDVFENIRLGITDEQFSRIHGPVGLNIGAKSPAARHASSFWVARATSAPRPATGPAWEIAQRRSTARRPARICRRASRSRSPRARVPSRSRSVTRQRSAARPRASSHPATRDSRSAEAARWSDASITSSWRTPQRSRSS